MNRAGVSVVGGGRGGCLAEKHAAEVLVTGHIHASSLEISALFSRFDLDDKSTCLAVSNTAWLQAHNSWHYITPVIHVTPAFKDCLAPLLQERQQGCGSPGQG